MKLTVQQVFDVTPVIASIIRERRPMPLRGSYRLACLHAKLLPEFNTIAAQRDAAITAYDYKEQVKDEHGQVVMVAEQHSVPPEKMDEFRAQWSEIAEESIDLDVEPIPLGLLDLGPDREGPLNAQELLVLGDLVTE